ncbi:MAG: hypothetical protein U0232_10635 [Thermomicrobiales bacterium]
MGARTIGHFRPGDPQPLQVYLPRLQVGTVWHRQPDMIEAGPRLGEGLATVGVVAMQRDDEAPGASPSNLPVPPECGTSMR